MEETIQVSKLDAAQRQLETAIRMFFREDDPVAIHTLAAAAHQVLWDIAKKQGMMSLLKSNPFIRKERQKEYYDVIVEAENFFKHGQKDPSSTINFNPETTAFFLFDGINIYRQVVGSYSPAMMSMLTWFQLKYRDIFVKDTLGKPVLLVLEKLHLNPEDKPSFLAVEKTFQDIARSLLLNKAG